MISVIYIFLAIAALLLAISYYFCRLLIYPHVHSSERTYQEEVESGLLNPQQFEAWEKEEICIASPFGYPLRGFYLPLPGSHKTVVITHGITWSLYGSVKYAAIFRSLGFNTLIYDLRYHGKSGGDNSTFGYYEKYDLKAVVDWASNRLGEGGIIGTMGESLGAAVSILHAAMDARVAFVIQDCGYSDLRELLVYRLKYDYHLPPFPLLDLTAFFCTRIAGMAIRKVSPQRDLQTLSQPVLFIHGQQDKYIPPAMTTSMYESKKQGCRQIYLAPKASHARSLACNPDAYKKVVADFIAALDSPAPPG